MAQFLRSAKHAHWSKEHIDTVLEDARSGDYLHALEVLWEAIAEIEKETEVSVSY